jgi:hypothetical protein
MKTSLQLLSIPWPLLQDENHENNLAFIFTHCTSLLLLLVGVARRITTRGSPMSSITNFFIVFLHHASIYACS